MAADEPTLDPPRAGATADKAALGLSLASATPLSPMPDTPTVGPGMMVTAQRPDGRPRSDWVTVAAPWPCPRVALRRRGLMALLGAALLARAQTRAVWSDLGCPWRAAAS